MEVLYIGPYRQLDSWGQTSRGLLSLLAGQDIDLIARPVWFTGDQRGIDLGELEVYESKELVDRNVLIQHGLPSSLNYNGDFKTNIAVTSIDCDVSHTNWIDHLNLFDLVIVFSDFEKELLEKSDKLTVDVVALSHPPHSPSNEIADLDLSNIKERKFYAVGSTDIKSATKELLISFLASFSILDDVTLLLATDQPKEMEGLVGHIKQHLGIFSDARYYPNIAIINSASQSIMNYLHQVGDIYVDVGYNLRMGGPVLDAIANSSLTVLLDTCKYGSVSVKSQPEIMFTASKPLPYLYTGHSTWQVPNTAHLSYALKEVINRDDFPSTEKTMHNQLDSEIKEILCTL